MTAKNTTKAALAGGFVGTAAFMAFAGEPGRPGWWLLALPFGVWAAGPYALAAVFLRRVHESRAAVHVLLGAAVLLSSISLYLLFEAFVFRPDPQSGIVFVVLPVWQCLGLLPFLAAALLLHRRSVRQAR